MTAIHRALENITVGDTQAFENLSVTALLAPIPGTAGYLTLDEAQALGLATVTEVSESGDVPTLLLENAAEQAVFLLDGEELVGAKQNRILNLTLLVPAKATLEIPVSCVEQGRWHHSTREFASQERAMYSRGRARKAMHVSVSLRDRCSRETDQGVVWEDIEEKMERMAVDSDTAAMSDAFEHYAGSVDAYVEAFQVGETQVGACFAINGTIRGVELFDANGTLGKLMPKLIRSYALDAIEERQDAPAGSAQNVRDFLGAVAGAPVDTFAALGEGEDLRIHSDAIAGGALAARNRLIHLCAFVQETQSASSDGYGGGGLQQAHLRRRRYRAA